MLRGLLGAVVLSTVTLAAGCGGTVKPWKDEAELPRSRQRDASGFEGARNVSTLAKTPARRAGAVVGTRADPDAAADANGNTGARPAGMLTMASLDDDADPSANPLTGPFRGRAVPPSAASGQALTRLVAFEAAPFPYDGVQPGRGPFLNAGDGARRGHRTARGGVLWEDRTFSDNRVLVHIPAGFDPNRQAVMVVFFHGHGATLRRDVLERQRIAEQVSASGANAVLVAPQFAIDARDSSAGKFWEDGGFRRFLDEAGVRLAGVAGDAALARRFSKMPVLLVSYSGGYVPAAYSLEDVTGSPRVRGVLMLDSLYGEEERFASWISASRSAFFVSAYTRYTTRHNAALQSMLGERGISSGTALPDSLSRGGVVFLATGGEANHQDYCTQAWAEDPIKDVLARLPELYLRDPETVASIGGRGRRRSADAEPR